MTLQERAAVQIVAAVGETIRDLGEVPSGHLYARLLGMPGMSNLTAAQYQSMIDALKHAGLVTERSYLLTWTRPKKDRS